MLDGFCGDGGAARGYADAGFYLVGNDLNPNVGKRYPSDSFHAGDWRDVFDEVRSSYPRLVFAHLSPPCQRWSQGTVAGHAHKHPDYIADVRDYLLDWGIPFVIENVPRSPLVDPVTLCGTMFDLTTYDPASGRYLYLKRHRLFEAHGFTLEAPRPCRCAEFDAAGLVCGGVYGGARSDLHEARNVRHGGYVPKAFDTRAALMGVDPAHFTVKGLSEAIPPAYGRHVGAAAMAQLFGREAA